MSQPVSLTTRQHSSRTRPESASRLVVFMYLASKVVQEPLSFEGAGHAHPFRSSILLVPGSCGVFPLHEPTRIGHRNLLTVPIPSTLESAVTGITSNTSQISKIPGRTGTAATELASLGGRHLKSLPRQSVNRPARNQCYSATVHQFQVRSNDQICWTSWNLRIGTDQ